MEEKQEKQIKLTYETLFEILQREKNRGELQKLDDTFFQDTRSYLQKKIKISISDNEQSKLFEEQAKLKTLHELKNIKKIIKEIYEKRERKIIDLALTRSRTANIIQNTNLLPEEELLHADLLTTFDKNRRELLHTILNPRMTNSTSTISPSIQQSIQTPITTQITPEIQPETQIQPTTSEMGQQITETQAQETSIDTISPTKTIRFIQQVSQFVGEELETYGPFEAEDIANLPTELAKVLINKQKAEEISTS